MKRSALLVVLGITLSGCSLLSLGGGTAPTTGGIDGGIFKSFNRGENFVQITQVPSISDQKPSISHSNIVSYTVDPQDRLAIYLGTREEGMFYSYNGGNSWTKSPLAPQSRINAIAVDPKNKCTIYAAVGHQVFKSTDCSRSWGGTFIQDRPDHTLTALAIDHATPSIVYAADVFGNLYKSTDFASSWTTIGRFQNAVRDIIIDPSNSSTIYLATATGGLRKSVDSGDSWEDINEGLQPYPGSLNYRRMILNPSKSNSLFLASQYGILKTEDGGETWATMPLLTAPNAANIFAIAVNPENDNELHYATERTLFSTFDGGQNWVTKQLGTTRIPTYMFIDPVDTATLYLTVATPL